MRFVVSVAALGLALAWSPLAKADPYQKALQACRSAAEAAVDPTDYKCNWKALLRGMHGAALTGRYVGRFSGMAAEMTLIEGGGPALVGISSVNTRSTHTCTLAVKGDRGADDVLAVGSSDEPKCVVRIVSSGPNQLRVTSTEPCQSFCGVSARFDGVYRLRK